MHIYVQWTRKLSLVSELIYILPLFGSNIEHENFFSENTSSSGLISTVDMKTEYTTFKKEILACNGLFPLRKHKIWFGSNSWGEYFLRKKCELMSVLAVLELHLAQSI